MDSNRFRFALLAAFVSFVPVSCVCLAVYVDVARSLPNGCSVVYTDNHNAGIVSSRGLNVVPPHVVDWIVVADLVVGKTQDGRIFELDTKTGDLVELRGKPLKYVKTGWPGGERIVVAE